MAVYTLEESSEIMSQYFQNHGNVLKCVRNIRMEFERREAPSSFRLKNCIHTLESLCTQNEQMSEADFDPEA